MIKLGSKAPDCTRGKRIWRGWWGKLRKKARFGRKGTARVPCQLHEKSSREECLQGGENRFPSQT